MLVLPADHRIDPAREGDFRRVLADAEGDDVLATTAFAGALLGLAAGLRH